MVETINKLHRIQRELMQELQREPTPEELAARMETTPERIVQILKIAQEPVSPEMPFGDEDYEETRFESTVLSTLSAEELQDALSALSHRERIVLQMRYGLDGSSARTLEEIARAFGVTRERIRLIESRALKKLEPAERASLSAGVGQIRHIHALASLTATEGAGMLDGELVDLVPYERIVVRWRFADSSGTQAVSDSLLTLSLRRASDDATRLVLIHERPRTGEPARRPLHPAEGAESGERAPDRPLERSEDELREALAAAIGSLPDRERLVETLYRFEKLSLHEIGEVLAIGESHASRLHMQATRRLRARMRHSLDPGADLGGVGDSVSIPGVAVRGDSGWCQALNRLAATVAEAR
jgi:RNA polymerase sigma factor (sigma-70 family)